MSPLASPFGSSAQLGNLPFASSSTSSIRRNRGRRRSLQIKRLIPPLDFELAIWQMGQLLVHPRKV
jgi:hypothetical protein